MLTVGLLTGVSYVSGIDYYRKINEGVAAALASPADIAGGHSSKMVAYSADLEEYVGLLAEAEAADQGRGDYAATARWFADLVARYLSGADFVVIASNTVHLAVAEVGTGRTVVSEIVVPIILANLVSIKVDGRWYKTTMRPSPTRLEVERRGGLPPVLHIADCVAADCRAKWMRTVGLVGTPHTMKQDWLLGRLRAHGLQVRPQPRGWPVGSPVSAGPSCAPCQQLYQSGAVSMWRG
jgi:aspartate/glutamate racemase